MPVEVVKPRSGQRAKEVTDIKVRIGVHAETPVILRRRPVVGNAKPQKFFSFHHHSTFSYLDGYQLPEAHVRRIAELNMAGLCMSEHGNIDSHTQFERAAKKAGVKAVFGCEVYMPVGTSGEGETQRKHHLTVIARNQEGYRNLLKLVTDSWNNFYHEPTVTWNMLRKYKRGLIILSGCQGSLLFCSTVGGKGISEEDASYRRGLAVARKFKNEFGKWYFIEVQAFPELVKTRKFNALAGKIARTVGTKLVGTMDCHYCVLEEQEVQKILHNLRPGNKQTIEERARDWGYDVPLCPPPSDRSIYRKLRATGLGKAEAIEAIVTTEELAQECNVELPQLPMVKFPLPDGYTDHVAYWRDLLRLGWKFRGLHKLQKVDQKRYRERLIIERDLIESKDFVNYFLLVQAGVRHVKDLGIPVGPARGSAAASVAAWLLRITEVDPLREDFGGLLRFERFIDDSREDLPDIDLDFPSRARPILRKFYERLLGGSDFVTNVGTFIYFRNKIALDDVARVFRVPKWEVEKVKNYLIERSSADLRASSTVEDTIAQFPEAAEVIERHPELTKAALLEGGIKGFGVHAAALVLSNDPIVNVTSIATREVPKGSGNVVQVVGLDKRDAEYRGLLKMDFLGLNTMSMIEDMIKHPLVGMDINELYGLPLRDKAIYDRFEANDVVGIFQWDGRATRFVNGAVKPRIFRELMDINALSRPGPLHGGGTREYIETKHGRQKPESLHPALDILTAPTQYQIVYQEQILNILRTVGNFPWGVTAEIRKIISKKHGEQAFNAKKAQFMEGVATIHKRMDVPRMDEEVGDKIWRRMITAGSYAFNAAHCASYSLIAYYCVGGQTKLYDWDNERYITVAKAFRDGVKNIACYDEKTGKTIPGRVKKVVRTTGAKNVDLKEGWCITTSSAKKLKCSADHLILTPNGYKPLRNLNVGDEIAAEKRYSYRSEMTYSEKEQLSNALRRSWREKSEAQREDALRGLNRTRGSGSKKMWAGMSPEEKARRVTPLIESAARSSGSLGVAPCGATTHSPTEIILCKWFMKNGIDHVHQIPVANGIADFCVKGVFIEIQHHRQKRHTEQFLERKFGEEPYVVTNDRDYEDDLHWILEETYMRSGNDIVWDTIKKIEPVGEMVMYDIVMEKAPHNFLANGIVVHNCMFFKVYHPSVFYYAALKHLSKDKRKELIRDAEQHGVSVLPPSLRRSGITWRTRNRQNVRAGFQEVEGIGPKMAPLIIRERKRKPFRQWNDLTRVKGIGPKKVQSITEFATKDDPFDVYKLERNIAKVKKEIMAGHLGAIPVPTHSGAQIDENPGKRIPVVWLGTITNRNVRDLFEYTYSKTGEELDPATVKDPELREWVVCRGEDDTEPVMLKINRWKYPKFKDAIMASEMEQDLVLVQGRRPEFAGTRQINVDNIWVIAPDEEEDQMTEAA